MRDRDFQRQKVYDWERLHVAPRCMRTVDRDNVQCIIDGIWLSLGLMYPPHVENMPTQKTTARADANRHIIRFTENSIPMWLIAHELSHSLTGTLEHNGDRHGPNFMGMYLRLLDQVCGIPLAYTMFTLQKTNIKYNLTAVPTADRMMV